MLIEDKSYAVPEVKLLRLRECATEQYKCDAAEHIYGFWNQHVVNASWYDPERESVVVFCLNSRRILKHFSLVAIGSVDSVLLYPREVFRIAIAAVASSIIIAHNHPTGDPAPSEGDIKITRDLLRGGQLLKIELTDSVVIGSPGYGPNGRGYHSLRELGYFYS